MIPKDPMILLSYVNTQLRDYYDSLEALMYLPRPSEKRTAGKDGFHRLPL